MIYHHRKETECPEKHWRYCVLCGQNYAQQEIFYTNATKVPVLGETLTGVTSGKSATVSEVNPLNSKNGMVVVTNPTGDFIDLEPMTGSSGAAATCHYYAEKRYGISYPEDQLALYEGKEYCLAHYGALMIKLWDKSIADIKEVR